MVPLVIQALLGNKQNKKEEEDGGMGEADGDGASKQQHKLGGDPKLKQLVYEMRVKNQVIYAFPNINMIMKVKFNVLYAYAIAINILHIAIY